MARVASRRAFLSGGAIALASTSAVAAGLPAAGPHEIDRLWGELLGTVASYNVISREYHERERGLPWWAVPGPKWLVAEGEPERQETCHTPAIQGLERPRPGVFRLLRPTPRDLQRDFETSTRIWGAERAQLS
jgi:hypothetical protein